MIKKHFIALSLRSHKQTHPTCNTKNTQEVQFWTQLLGPTNWGEEWEKRRKTQSRDTHGFNYGQWPTMIRSTIFAIFLRLCRLWPWISPLFLHPFNFAVLTILL